jgi:hypothetical protein
VIEVAGARFFIPATTEGLSVAATIFTSRRQPTIRLDGDIIARHPFPIGEKPVSPNTLSPIVDSSTTSTAKRCPEDHNLPETLNDVMRRVP